ncbi:MAG: hypothetical protein AB7S77_12815 [Desulfatirhabdiaceae bacterium]
MNRDYEAVFRPGHIMATGRNCNINALTMPELFFALNKPLFRLVLLNRASMNPVRIALLQPSTPENGLIMQPSPQPERFNLQSVNTVGGLSDKAHPTG